MIVKVLVYGVYCFSHLSLQMIARKIIAIILSVLIAVSGKKLLS